MEHVHSTSQTVHQSEVYWGIGDRVYSVSKPYLTGTVSGVTEGAGRGVLVTWDQAIAAPYSVPCMWDGGDLECYTRPAQGVA